MDNFFSNAHMEVFTDICTQNTQIIAYKNMQQLHNKLLKLNCNTLNKINNIVLPEEIKHLIIAYKSRIDLYYNNRYMESNNILSLTEKINLFLSPKI